MSASKAQGLSIKNYSIDCFIAKFGYKRPDIRYLVIGSIFPLSFMFL